MSEHTKWFYLLNTHISSNGKTTRRPVSMWTHLFSFQLWICTSHVEIMFPFVWFCRQWPTVTSLFSQVEVGDIIRVNGSDFVPADAVILSSRYRSPSCCLTMENLSSLPFFLFLLSLLSLKKWWLDSKLRRDTELFYEWNLYFAHHQ